MESQTPQNHSLGDDDDASSPADVQPPESPTVSTDINQTILPPPGLIEVTSVKPDSVCLKWGSPEGLIGEQQKFWVTWNSHTAQCSLPVRGLNLNIQDLSPGVTYDVTVATLGDHGNNSQGVSACFCTEIPEPQNLVTETDATSVSVTWRKPAGLDQVSYILTLCKDGECVENVSTDTVEYAFSNLQTDTEYTISVCTTSLNGNQSKAVLRTITTGNGPTKSPVNSENHPSEFLPIEKLTERCQQLTTGNPACFLLPTKKSDIDGNSAVRRWTFGGKHKSRKIKTVLMVGETGAGKTTLINTMVNHILGVKWEDRLWFQITEENKKKLLTESQTSEITVYEMETSSSYLRVIDTPGYGDTTSKKLDKQVSQNLDMLFCSENGIHEIDAVGLVVKSTQNRLTEFQKYIFDAILSLFGKDIEEHIVVFITHSDGLPAGNILTALREAEVPCAKDDRGRPLHFLFNNRQTENREEEHFRRPWDLGQHSMESFFSFLECIDAKELKMTKGVLRERRRLEACVNNLQDAIKMEELKQKELQQTQRALEENKGKSRKKKDFTYAVDEPYKAMVPIESSWWHLSKTATCCLFCKENCHYPGCWVKDLSWCSVMKDGRCTVCTNKCPVSAHAKQKMIYEPKTREVTRTSETLKRRYTDLKEYKTVIEEELKESISKKAALLEQAYQCIVKLEDIALKRNSNTLIHLDFLIEKMKETGAIEKVQKLEELNKIIQAPNKITLAHLADDLVPENLTVDSVTATSANISWGRSRETKQLPHSFLISYQSEGTEPQTFSSECRSSAITGLKPYTEYTVSVSTQLLHGIKSQAAVTTVHTELPVPETLTAEAGETSVSVTWGKPAGLDQLSYSLTLSKDGEALETVYTKSLRYNFSDLQTDTEYTISVCTTLSNGDHSLAVVHTTHTGKPLACGDSDNGRPDGNHSIRELIEKCQPIKTGTPACYLLPTEKSNIEGNSALRRWTFGERDKTVPTKTVLLIGETGAGKTALINTIINFILGVEWEDGVWFQITKQNTTTDITVYEVFVETSSSCLRIIDSPGYGSADWTELDQKTAENLRFLFRCEDGIHEIDAVGLVVRSTQSYVTQFHHCIFEPILSEFGEGIEKKTAVFITHSEGIPATNVLTSLRKAKVPCAKDPAGKPLHFLFNNQQTERHEEDQERAYYAAWNLGRDSMKEFWGFLEDSQLGFTDASEICVKERKRLEARVSNLKDAVTMEIMNQNKLQQTNEALEKNKRKLDKNENFLFEVEEPYKGKVSIKSSLWQLSNGAMCCPICQENCHYPDCGWVQHTSACIVMKNNRCTVCTGKCPASSHVKQRKIFIPEKRRVVKHAVELKQHYGEQVDVKKAVEKELNKSKAKMSNLLEKAYRCMFKLKTTGSKRDCMSILPHLHYFINKTKEMGDDDNVQKFKELYEQIQTPSRRRAKFFTRL
ncbi:uncharacterized protein LOC143099294 isoform X2 [Alosa pseudoharengus]|uniref:uncharacterized protein LOC143099294 isoform X2 n=1 Tax=Alosa pseudoharengus TaxID=34774 RepID=UPI003F8AE51C